MTAFTCVKSVIMENAGRMERMKVLKEVVEKERRRKEEEERLRKEEEERLRKEEEERKRKEEEERLRKEEEERLRKEEEERLRREEEERNKREQATKKEKREKIKPADPNKTVKVASISVLESIGRDVCVVIIAADCCNVRDWLCLDMSEWVCLREFQVGNSSLQYVEEVKMIGLQYLETIIIGQYCFRRDTSRNPNRHFYLKDCERLRELKIGPYSFSDYSVCEIENVPSLEVIEMGKLDGSSENFCYASLELKNMPKLKSLMFGTDAFEYCSRAVFENLPELASIRFGYDAFRFSADVSSELIMKS
ncbi:hypothetical protein BLSTO_03461 [Blastocystis sp. subtype 1]